MINEGVCNKVVSVLSDLLSRRMYEGITTITGSLSHNFYSLQEDMNQVSPEYEAGVPRIAVTNLHA
jgi:hypothetical protein